MACCADKVLQDELLSLADSYGGSREKQLADSVIQSMAGTVLRKRHHPTQPLAAGMAQLISNISSLGAQYGQGHMVVSQHRADEECERELEQEEEEEEEIEREVPAVTPAREVDWNYRAGWAASSAQEVSTEVRCVLCCAVLCLLCYCVSFSGLLVAQLHAARELVTEGVRFAVFYCAVLIQYSFLLPFVSGDAAFQPCEGAAA